MNGCSFFQTALSTTHNSLLKQAFSDNMKIKAMFTLYQIAIRGGGRGREGCLRDYFVGDVPQGSWNP